MTSPPAFAPRIARERWNADLVIRGRRRFGAIEWRDLPQCERDDVILEVEAMLRAIKAAGLAVVEAEDGR